MADTLLAGLGKALTPQEMAAGAKGAVIGQGTQDPTLGQAPSTPTAGLTSYSLNGGATGATPVSRSLYNPETGTNLANSLEQSYENSAPYQSILSSYQAATGATGAQYQAAGKQLGVQYGQDIQQKEQENRVALDNTMTARSLATNTALLAQQQDQADYRIKNLRDQMDAALSSNNTAAAAKLADLATQEQSAITAARTSFLNTYFQGQAEARAQASFQTPEQQAVLSLANTYPQAGVTPADTLAQAQQKVGGSAQYQLTQTATKAQVTQALAQAQQAGASAEQTRVMTSLVQNPDSQGDVTALLNHSLTPDQLRTKYANYPGGFGAAIAANILSEAQSKGYDINAATLRAQGQQGQIEALNSGNPLSVLGGLASQGANAVINAFTGAPRTLTPQSTTPAFLNTNASIVNPVENQRTTVNGVVYVFTGGNWVKTNWKP